MATKPVYPVTSVPPGPHPSTADSSGAGGAGLSVRDLRIAFGVGRRGVPVVHGVDLDIGPGEIFALVGESGSGKSVTARALMGLLPPAGRVIGGSAQFGGTELLGRTGRRLREIRGGRIGMVFQDPMSSLNPLMRIGDQIEEAVRGHSSGRDVRRRAGELLELVGIPDPHRRLREYPHTYSGGMRQRVMIAIALAGNPDLIIADEPTTALDVTVQAQVIELLTKVNAELGTSILMITHNLGIVAGFAHRMSVMYAGRIVETGPVAEVFRDPAHPYTRGLLRSVVTLESQPRTPLPAIPGRPPNPGHLPRGCAYAPRCDVAVDACLSGVPPLAALVNDHHAACLLTGAAADPAPPTWARRPAVAASPAAGPVLRVAGLRKEYGRARLARFGRSRGVTAVDGIDLTINSGETVGVVGESGCGKSTVARLVLAIETPTEGTIEVLGQDIHQASGKEMKALRRQVQLVFQDPLASLNPRHTVAETIGEPLHVHQVVPRARRSARIRELLNMVGLDESYRDRYPRQLSGGQRQRVGVARALTLEPRLLVLDEPVSSLDVSMQAEIINLLREIGERTGVASLFIAHDIALVRHLCDRIMVMYMGRIVEEGPAATICARPQHPYTACLLSAVPRLDTGQGPARIPLYGEVPSPLDPPGGCTFHPRCPIGPAARPDRDVCRVRRPAATDTAGGGRTACHFPGEITLAHGATAERDNS